MLAHRLRPAFRAASHVRAASTSSSASSAPTASRLTLGRLAVLGALAGGAAIALNAGAESRRVWNDGERLHNYDENLKVNRHKIAAQQGKTPETALNNSKATSSTHHVGKDATGGELKDGAVPGTDAGKGLPSAGSSSSGSGAPGLDDAAATQEQAGQEGAFNEETGEINWDCPCLGGMAHGPCGEQFRAAFSCFVFSEQEPKGIDCVDKFKLMQDCFREHPEQYGEEIDDDDDAAPVPTESNSPLSAPIVAKPLAADHPEADKIPKKPNAAPPPHSDIPRQTHLNNPAKGVQKLQPRKNRADKPEGAPPGDGSI